ncbi:11428_t:CDS:1, partial [Gigaspora rosea]
MRNNIKEVNHQPTNSILASNYYPAITSLKCSEEFLTAHLEDGRVV